MKIKNSKILVMSLCAVMAFLISACNGLFEPKYLDEGTLVFTLLQSKDGFSVKGDEKGYLVEIPAEYDGLPVREIANASFMHWNKT
ncbi:MAG: hypothetical protein RBR44_05395, partial [Bacilli bacterium]|nr:hypothetical protein [Bacilli bacterium]